MKMKKYTEKTVSVEAGEKIRRERRERWHYESRKVIPLS